MFRGNCEIALHRSSQSAMTHHAFIYIYIEAKMLCQNKISMQHFKSNE